MAVLLDNNRGSPRNPPTNNRASLAGLIHIARPKTTILAILYALLGAYLEGGFRALAVPRAWGAAIVVGLAVAFSFVINDRCDLTADQFAKPNRPLPSGELSLRGAAFYAAFLALIALAIAWILGPLLCTIALAAFALSVIYSYRLKNTVLLGNATVAVLDATIVIYGAVSVSPIRPVILLLGGVIALYTLAEEVLFTLKDCEGDRRAGVHTVATSWGASASLSVYRTIVAIFILVAPMPWILGLASPWYLLAIVICSMLPVGAVAISVSVVPTTLMFKQGAKWMKLIWLFSILPVLLLR
jgi:geranylgeranylglycerol-phosphate geranylgeranyltransferase